MTPESEAERLGLKYIGSMKPLKFSVQYYFNDLTTRSTLVVFELEELEDKVNKSRRRFKDAKS